MTTTSPGQALTLVRLGPAADQTGAVAVSCIETPGRPIAARVRCVNQHGTGHAHARDARFFPPTCHRNRIMREQISEGFMVFVTDGDRDQPVRDQTRRPNWLYRERRRFRGAAFGGKSVHSDKVIRTSIAGPSRAMRSAARDSEDRIMSPPPRRKTTRQRGIARSKGIRHRPTTAFGGIRPGFSPPMDIDEITPALFSPI